MVCPCFFCSENAPRSAGGRPTTSSQRQVERLRRVGTGCETVVLIERLGLRILGIDDQRIRGNLFARQQAAFQGAANEQLAQTPATPIRAACQTTHAEARHRIARELRAIRVELTRIADMLACLAAKHGDIEGLRFPPPDKEADERKFVVQPCNDDTPEAEETDA